LENSELRKKLRSNPELFLWKKIGVYRPGDMGYNERKPYCLEGLGKESIII
jgi:hypothetical protein